MRRVLASCLLSASALLASGANALETKNHAFKPGDLDRKAWVLLSTSADRVRSWGTARALYLSRVVIKGKSQRRSYKHVWTLSIDNSFGTSHSPSEHLEVHWLALEPGEYYLTERVISQLYCLPTYNSFNFNVTAGQTVYLGNYHLAEGQLQMGDTYARDYEVFTAKSNGEKPASFDPTAPTPELKADEICEREGR